MEINEVQLHMLTNSFVEYIIYLIFMIYLTNIHTE